VTLEGLLFVVIAGLLMLNWPVAVILIRAALHRPRIRALTVMATITTIIAVALTAYVLAVVNAGSGYVLPREIAQIVIRGVFVTLALFPVWFLWLYRTGRFHDGSGE
jgi:hypothetical protein